MWTHLLLFVPSLLAVVSQSVLRIHEILMWIRILAIFVIDLQETIKKLIFVTKFFCFILFEGTFTSFFTDKKVKKKWQNSRIQGFSYYFCLVMDPDPDPGGSKTYGFGSATLLVIC